MNVQRVLNRISAKSISQEIKKECVKRFHKYIDRKSTGQDIQLMSLFG